MLKPILDALIAFLEVVFPFEAGTAEFYILLGCAIGGMLIVARLLSGVFSSSKGIVITAFAVMIPLLLAALGYVLIELYALPEIQADWAEQFLPWATFGIVFVLAGALVSSKLWDFSKVSAVLALVLAGFAGMSLQYAAQVVMGVVDAGGSQVEKRERVLDESMENTN
ncbi:MULTISPECIES: hypothetical protein [unclassified Lentimonas]|uniref:hypothetical protein n=1 Tax=unclassified Lentimonas TaxID=2630993 RepID=UPI0013285395|nr:MULTISPECIES: hypothetical protein [unclassified Lentimonas]CAA6680000.1 Unannotated [Lentimonas sp. CC4]CAA6686556.1 Unannotated [Lentimonas sp. CC6]CAA7074832.1 Unannotated [Lentimonas sp. CC4]CAA7169459.1 Unannotated [Lentimonas sp. CC21]CAA7180150.1 Unannotated [Lentimonas sp. CC8]